MKEALRTGQIEIDTQKMGDEQWIAATIQNLELNSDGSVASEKMRDGKVYRKVSDVALEMITVTDPVTQQQLTMSVAGMGTAIKTLMIKWILEDNANTTYDANLGMVIKNDPSS